MSQKDNSNSSEEIAIIKKWLMAISVFLVIAVVVIIVLLFQLIKQPVQDVVASTPASSIAISSIDSSSGFSAQTGSISSDYTMNSNGANSKTSSKSSATSNNSTSSKASSSSLNNSSTSTTTSTSVTSNASPSSSSSSTTGTPSIPKVVSYNLKANKNIVNNNQAITFTVYSSKINNMYGYDFEIAYDKTAFEYVDGSLKSKISNLTFVFASPLKNGTSLAGTLVGKVPTITGTYDICEFQLKPIKTGEHTVEIKNVDIADGNKQLITYPDEDKLTISVK